MVGSFTIISTVSFIWSWGINYFGWASTRTRMTDLQPKAMPMKIAKQIEAKRQSLIRETLEVVSVAT